MLTMMVCNSNIFQFLALSMFIVILINVGETSSHLHMRVSDHLGILALTGKKWKCPSPMAILSHHADTGHPISFGDFKIISSCYSESELLLWESLLISKLKPSLNADMDSAPLFLF